MATQKRKFGFNVEYRLDGRWVLLNTFSTKERAEDYAKTSYSCRNYGYQIKRVRVR